MYKYCYKYDLIPGGFSATIIVMTQITKRPVRLLVGGRYSKNVTLGPRAMALVQRAAQAAATTHSGVVERLILAHAEQLIAEEQAALDNA
jgi:hypothetical protein